MPRRITISIPTFVLAAIYSSYLNMLRTLLEPFTIVRTPCKDPALVSVYGHYITCQYRQIPHMIVVKEAGACNQDQLEQLRKASHRLKKVSVKG